MADRVQGGNRRLYEVQIHSPRGRVRYLTVTVLTLQMVFVAGLLLGVFVLNGTLAAPAVVRVEFFRAGQAEVIDARRRYGERFEALAGRYAEVRQLASDLDDRLCKVVLAYGLEGAAADDCGRASDLRAQPSTAGLEQVQDARTAVEQDLEQVADRLQSRLLAAFEVESAWPELVDLTPSVAPLRGDDFVLVAPFGETKNRVTSLPEFHDGIDLAAAAGAPVRATAAGRVTYAGRGSALGPTWRRYGLLVGIRHGDRFITIYGHLDQTEVRAGSTVARGQRIGTVGATGWSLEPNLHYAILRRRNDDRYGPIEPRIHILDYRWRDERALVSAVVTTPDDFPSLPPTLLR